MATLMSAASRLASTLVFHTTKQQCECRPLLFKRRTNGNRSLTVAALSKLFQSHDRQGVFPTFRSPSDAERECHTARANYSM
jgi:hypothetical protein